MYSDKEVSSLIGYVPIAFLSVPLSPTPWYEVSRHCPCGIVVHRLSLGRVIHTVLEFPPVSYSSNAPYSVIQVCHNRPIGTCTTKQFSDTSLQKCTKWYEVFHFSFLVYQTNVLNCVCYMRFNGLNVKYVLEITGKEAAVAHIYLLYILMLIISGSNNIMDHPKNKVTAKALADQLRRFVFSLSDFYNIFHDFTLIFLYFM